MTSGTMGWEHGTLSFDNNGLGHMTGIVRNGTSLSDRDGIPYTMSLSGMLLDPADNTFQCVVSRDRSVMVAVTGKDLCINRAYQKPVVQRIQCCYVNLPNRMLKAHLLFTAPI